MLLRATGIPSRERSECFRRRRPLQRGATPSARASGNVGSPGARSASRGEGGDLAEALRVLFDSRATTSRGHSECSLRGANDAREALRALAGTGERPSEGSASAFRGPHADPWLDSECFREGAGVIRRGAARAPSPPPHGSRSARSAMAGAPAVSREHSERFREVEHGDRGALRVRPRGVVIRGPAVGVLAGRGRASAESTRSGSIGSAGRPRSRSCGFGGGVRRRT